MKRCIAAPIGYWQATNGLFGRLCLMMAEALLNSAHIAQHGAFSVAAPFVGDSVSGALLRAYDETEELPADLRSLLDSLDGID